MLEKIERNEVSQKFKTYLYIVEGKINFINTRYPKCSGSHLKRLIEEAINNSEKYPLDKLSRWLGFTQGVLVSNNLLTINKDYDFKAQSNESMNEKEKEAVQLLFPRYLVLIEDHKESICKKVRQFKADYLYSLCKDAVDNHENYSFNELSKRLGFVQGLLATDGIIDVDEERDFTRPILHAIHEFKIPTFK